MDSEQLCLFLGANKISTVRCDADKRKLMVNQLGMDVGKLFPDSLDNVRTLYPTNLAKNKNVVHVIPRVEGEKDLLVKHVMLLLRRYLMTRLLPCPWRENRKRR